MDIKLDNTSGILNLNLDNSSAKEIIIDPRNVLNNKVLVSINGNMSPTSDQTAPKDSKNDLATTTVLVNKANILNSTTHPINNSSHVGHSDNKDNLNESKPKIKNKSTNLDNVSEKVAHTTNISESKGKESNCDNKSDIKNNIKAGIPELTVKPVVEINELDHKPVIDFQCNLNDSVSPVSSENPSLLKNSSYVNLTESASKSESGNEDGESENLRTESIVDVNITNQNIILSNDIKSKELTLISKIDSGSTINKKASDMESVKTSSDSQNTNDGIENEDVRKQADIEVQKVMEEASKISKDKIIPENTVIKSEITIKNVDGLIEKNKTEDCTKKNCDTSDDLKISDSDPSNNVAAKTNNLKVEKHEATDERKEVVEEVMVKKDIPGTGYDDRVLEEWRNIESKKEKNDFLFDFENEIVASQPSRSKDDVLSDLLGEIVKSDGVVNTDKNEPKELKKKNEVKEELNKENKPEKHNVSVKQEVSKTQNQKGLPIKKENIVLEQNEIPSTDETDKKISDTKINSRAQSSETTDKPPRSKPTDEKLSKQQKSARSRDLVKLKQENELKKHHKKIFKAVSQLLPGEEGHDSGVDESTQSKDGRLSKGGTERTSAAAARRRQARSVDPTPLKRTPQSTASVERKLPMNKIEVGKTASPNIKNVRSKIGSLDNATHKPGGGKFKVESKKIDFGTTSSRIQAKNASYTPGGGDKKIEGQKLKWNVSSKVGSLEKKDHKPGGGDKKVESRKLNFKESAAPKVGSKDNIKHKAGGGAIEIQTEKLEFKTKASSRVGSLDNVKHKAKGGDKKIFDDKDYLKQMQPAQSPAKTPTSKTSSGRESEAVSPITTGTNSPGPQVTN